MSSSINLNPTNSNQTNTTSAAPRISKIGDEEVTYSLFSDRITHIGNEEVTYSFFSDRITHVGNKEVEYGSCVIL